MAGRQISKSVFKKLSALRATLTDEEQYILDGVLEGEHEIFAYATIDRNNVDKDERGQKPICIRVAYDMTQEIYLIE
jgi:hypothetical protein